MLASGHHPRQIASLRPIEAVCLVQAAWLLKVPWEGGKNQFFVFLQEPKQGQKLFKDLAGLLPRGHPEVTINVVPVVSAFLR